jgi:arginine decarboxylase
MRTSACSAFNVVAWIDTIVNYLKFARAFNERFPSFETDIHGLVKEDGSGNLGYYVDCVKN